MLCDCWTFDLCFNMSLFKMFKKVYGSMDNEEKFCVCFSGLRLMKQVVIQPSDMNGDGGGMTTDLYKKQSLTEIRP